MPIEIRETIVTPDASGDVVQLRISDAPLGDESAAFHLTILAKLPPSEIPLVGQLQREAMKVAQNALTPLLRDLAQKIQEQGYPLEPWPVRS